MNGKIVPFIFVTLFTVAFLFCMPFDMVCLSSEQSTPAMFMDNGFNLSKEIKYTSGEDGLWFSADDAIYDYSLFKYDSSGRVMEKICYDIHTTNEENEPLSKKRVSEYLLLQYDSDGKMVREILYTS